MKTVQAMHDATHICVVLFRDGAIVPCRNVVTDATREHERAGMGGHERRLAAMKYERVSDLVRRQVNGARFDNGVCPAAGY